MTHEQTGYTPVELETVDQVNALPIGTVATYIARYESAWDSYDIAVIKDEIEDAVIKDEIEDAAFKDKSGWIGTPPKHLIPEDLIGWIALIPTRHNETDTKCSPTK
ncbi:hypothetical protein HMPREF1484_02009 [Dermabacter sp. HFH0086]|uniref:hypothetical protein n=1 Tax=Dermabacter TaxID=36739 RepID=UPI00035372E9|nr:MULTISPECIES: hypothetical protein [Dermabacter]EPH14700.1 hypothetical protein HMPREF1484_02009 [Dermabacter sp. HFH0086]